jgi:hypothetical protein
MSSHQPTLVCACPSVCEGRRDIRLPVAPRARAPSSVHVGSCCHIGLHLPDIPLLVVGDHHGDWAALELAQRTRCESQAT